MRDNPKSKIQNPKSALQELWHYRPLILELVRRDLKLRYKNSIGGIAWSLLNPLLQIFVITVLMKFIEARPIENYSAYLFGIIFLWNFFDLCLQDGCVSILLNAQLVRKVYFPREILPLASVLSNLFHFGIAFVFTILYFFVPYGFGGVGAYPSLLRPEILMVLPAVFFTAVLALGCSLVLSYLNVFYEDVKFIVTAVMRLAFYAMPVFATIEQIKIKVPQEIYQLYMLNPIAVFLVTYQRALLPPPARYTPAEAVTIPYGYFALACLSSTLILALGFYLFQKYKWEMAERL